MSEFEDMKQNAMKAVLVSHAADYIDRLIEQVEQKISPTKTFTRAELITLLRGVSEGMRGGH